MPNSYFNFKVGPTPTLRIKKIHDYLIPPGWKRVKLMLDSNSRPSSLKTDALTTRPSYSFWPILMHVAILVYLVQYQTSPLNYIFFAKDKNVTIACLWMTVTCLNYKFYCGKSMLILVLCVLRRSKVNEVKYMCEYWALCTMYVVRKLGT